MQGVAPVQGEDKIFRVGHPQPGPRGGRLFSVVLPAGGMVLEGDPVVIEAQQPQPGSGDEEKAGQVGRVDLRRAGITLVARDLALQVAAPSGASAKPELLAGDQRIAGVLAVEQQPELPVSKERVSRAGAETKDGVIHGRLTRLFVEVRLLATAPAVIADHPEVEAGVAPLKAQSAVVGEA